eukprot:gnl/Spiro4/14539_TR7838_c0_g1_i1.p1 gnl/Spiro4/14539_TR7838_c0_g1~~gnl/Spiro4/14539_TR7838_c0_g1_i1.p1  ORF type:complete len:276 (-),score=43.47 gnl/Spiro4/14539_TR7838_c0_g1_i1:44-805(-)
MPGLTVKIVLTLFLLFRVLAVVFFDVGFMFDCPLGKQQCFSTKVLPPAGTSAPPFADFLMSAKTPKEVVCRYACWLQVFGGADIDDYLRLDTVVGSGGPLVVMLGVLYVVFVTPALAVVVFGLWIDAAPSVRTLAVFLSGFALSAMAILFGEFALVLPRENVSAVMVYNCLDVLLPVLLFATFVLFWDDEQTVAPALFLARNTSQTKELSSAAGPASASASASDDSAVASQNPKSYPKPQSKSAHQHNKQKRS